MRFKTTWILIAVFAALAAYMYFVENPRYAARQEAEKKEGLLYPGLQTDKVTELSIRGPKGEVRVKKGEGDRWYLVKPWEDRADDNRVGSLLSSLKELKAQKEVAGADADLSAFGLATPEAVVKTSGEEVSLAIGSENPAKDSRYVRAGDGPVRLSPASMLSGFLGDPSDLRDKDLLESFPWARLQSVEIRPAAGDAIQLVKKDQKWQIRAPIQAEADPQAAEQVAEKLHYARIDTFLEPTADDEKKLAGGLTVTLKAEGESEPVTVRLAEVDGKVWAERSGRKALFTVNKDVLAAFQVKPEELRRRRPALVQPWKAKKIELTRGQETRLYEKSDKGWERSGEALAGAERTALQDYLTALEKDKATAVVDRPGPDAEYGLDSPALVAHVWDADGNEQTATVGKKGDAVFARGDAPTPVYQMPAPYLSQGEALFQPPEAKEKKAPETPAETK
jgi:hypothetical protein